MQPLVKKVIQSTGKATHDWAYLCMHPLIMTDSQLIGLQGIKTSCRDDMCEQGCEDGYQEIHKRDPAEGFCV